MKTLPVIVPPTLSNLELAVSNAPCANTVAALELTYARFAVDQADCAASTPVTRTQPVPLKRQVLVPNVYVWLSVGEVGKLNAICYLFLNPE